MHDISGRAGDTQPVGLVGGGFFLGHFVQQLCAACGISDKGLQKGRRTFLRHALQSIGSGKAERLGRDQSCQTARSMRDRKRCHYRQKAVAGWQGSKRPGR